MFLPNPNKKTTLNLTKNQNMFHIHINNNNLIFENLNHSIKLINMNVPVCKRNTKKRKKTHCVPNFETTLDDSILEANWLNKSYN